VYLRPSQVYLRLDYLSSQ